MHDSQVTQRPNTRSHPPITAAYNISHRRLLIMSVDLLQPPSSLSPAAAVHISQRAPSYLASQAPSALSLPYPLSLLTSSESQEKWQSYENLLLACLRTGDDKSAYICLEQLTSRFGAKNERVQALQGVYDEAVAEDDAALKVVLRRYEDLLKETPTNMVRA